MVVKNNIKTWWLLLVAGIFLLAIGIYALISPFHTFINLITYSGVALFLNGIFLVIIASANVSFEKEKKWLIAESMIDFVFGIMLIFNPLLSFIVFPLLIGPWIFCIGILKVAAAIVLRKVVHGWLFILVAGILSIFFGWLIVYNPIPKASGITMVLGAFGITMGALNIFDAFRFRKTGSEVVMMF